MHKYIKYKGAEVTQDSYNLKHQRKYKKLIITFTVLVGIIMFFFSEISIDEVINNSKEDFISHLKIDVVSNLTDEYDILALKKCIYNNEQYIWEVDPWDLKKRVLEVVPQFKNVNVKITLPNSLYFKVTKRKPYAIWWHNNEFSIIDSDGVVIQHHVTDEEKRKYILVTGEDSTNNLNKIVTVLSSYSTQNGRIILLRFIGKRRWDIVLEDGTIVKLPENNMKDAIIMFNKLLNMEKIQNLLTPHCTIDMRLLPNRIFIKHVIDKPQINKDKVLKK